MKKSEKVTRDTVTPANVGKEFLLSEGPYTQKAIDGATVTIHDSNGDQIFTFTNSGKTAFTHQGSNYQKQ